MTRDIDPRAYVTFDPDEMPAELTPNRSAKPALLVAQPFVWRDPALIPPRDWLFGFHYIREFVSGSAAPGGTGKSFLLQAEILSMVSGVPFLAVQSKYPRLRAWYWNLEDPPEEIERRFAAAAIHHDIDPALIGDGLFVNSGRVTPLVVATKKRDETIIAQPVVDALVKEIREKQIDVLIIDPFISSHGVAENDNVAIDQIVKLWGRVASTGKCAVELVHHTRKTGGEAMTEESFRGAKSLVDGLRSARVLHPMAEEEAAQLGVEKERRRFFYSMPEKQTLAPPATERTWFRLASLALPNGDNMGVAERWYPPDPFDDVTTAHLEKVRTTLRSGSYKQSDQAADWGGYVVADVLQLDVGQGLRAKERTAAQRTAQARVKRILKTWEANGAIAVEMRVDPIQRREKLFFIVPDDVGND